MSQFTGIDTKNRRGKNHIYIKNEKKNTIKIKQFDVSRTDMTELSTHWTMKSPLVLLIYIFLKSENDGKLTIKNLTTEYSIYAESIVFYYLRGGLC